MHICYRYILFIKLCFAGGRNYIIRNPTYTKMKKNKFLLALLLFGMGLTGVLSMLTMDIPLPEDVRELYEILYTPGQIKLLTLVNPLILLIIAVVVGSLLHDRMQLEVPLLGRIIWKDRQVSVGPIIRSGMGWGVMAGLLLSIITYAAKALIPEQMEAIGGDFQPTLAARFLYGGITEEILMRFGLMTLLVWLASLLFKKLNNAVFWTGIVLSALLFAVGHFGVTFAAVSDPGVLLLSYVLLGNSVGGIIFGWLYWKRGLESGMIAHVMTHVVMVLVSLVAG